MFKMKQKPSEPKRAIIQQSLFLGDHANLQEIIDWANHYGAVPSSVRVKYEGGYDQYSNDGSYYFVLDTPEPIEQFNERMAKYNIQLEKYNKWAQENQAEIKQYHERQKQIAARRKEIEIEKTKKRIKELEKEKQKLLKKVSNEAHS